MIDDSNVEGMESEMTTQDRAGTAPEAHNVTVDPWLEAAVARQIEAEPEPEEVPTDSEIADWYRHFCPSKVFDKPFTKRQRRDFQRRKRELSKPSVEWKPVDAARYLSTSVTVRLPTPLTLLSVDDLTRVFTTLQSKYEVSMPAVAHLIDDYLDEAGLSQRLNEWQARRHFMAFLQRWLTRNVEDFEGDI